ncbi:MAG: ShlB/FhaC/HecB family hemolysin secretion/activation protein [Cyanobacteria bacterium P01_C01_bin.69]
MRQLTAQKKKTSSSQIRQLVGLFWLGLAAILCGKFLLRPAFAQQPSIPPNAPTPEEITPETTPPDLPAEFPTEESPPLSVPPVPDSSPFESAPTGAQFRIGEIELLGISVDPDELVVVVDGEAVSVSDRITALTDQVASLYDLLALRSFITQAYINAGYITSGAFIPEQDFLGGGTVFIQVVEGELELVEINGLSRLQGSYVRSRIQAQIKRPLQQANIEAALQRLQLNPLIDRVSAQLLAGSGPGQSILLLTLEEAPPLSAGVSVNNYRAVGVGSEQITPYLSYTNLLGIGDRINITDSLSEGLHSYSVAYTIPVNPYDGSLSFSFSNSDSRIIESEFEDLNIRGDSRTYSLLFEQPLIKSPNEELSLGLGFDLRRSETTVFNSRPFSDSQVSVLRFSQNWVKRTPSRVLAARSQLSLGLNAFNATITDSGPDGEFFSWQGQFQWVEQLPKNKLLISRLSSQLTADQLLSLEQFSLGGIRTVRGYRDSQFVRDNGIVVSTELRLPLTNPPERLQLTPFLEGGIGWNSSERDSLEGLASVGIGLLWQADDNTRLRLDYGYPLIDQNDDRDTLQENGFTFSLDWSL